MIRQRVAAQIGDDVLPVSQSLDGLGRYPRFAELLERHCAVQ